MSIAQIISCIFTGLSILGFVISVSLSISKSKKAGNNYGVLQLMMEIPSLVTQAEQMFGAGKGVSKCQWVLTQLQIKALQNNVKISDDALVSQINATVDATKNVNIG